MAISSNTLKAAERTIHATKHVEISSNSTGNLTGILKVELDAYYLIRLQFDFSENSSTKKGYIEFEVINGQITYTRSRLTLEDSSNLAGYKLLCDAAGVVYISVVPVSPDMPVGITITREDIEYAFGEVTLYKLGGYSVSGTDLETFKFNDTRYLLDIDINSLSISSLDIKNVSNVKAITTNTINIGNWSFTAENPNEVSIEFNEDSNS